MALFERRHLTITHGEHPKNPGEKLIHPSDEAFVVLCFENYSKRWPYVAECKKEKSAVNEMDPRNQVRWVEGTQGQQKFGGWSNEGRVRFLKITLNIAKSKRSGHVTGLENGILKEFFSKGKKSENEETNNEDEPEEFGGNEACVSFLDMDLDNVNLDDVDELEELDDDEGAFRKVKPKKKKKED